MFAKQGPSSDNLLELQEVEDSQDVSTRQSSTEVRNNDSAPKPPKKCAQVLVALLVLLASLITQYLNTYTLLLCIINIHDNKANDDNKNIAKLKINAQMKPWIVSLIIPLSASFGGIAGGPCIEYLGRKYTILATALPYIGSFLLIMLAQNAEMLLVGRALCGFSTGVISLSLPVYLGETMQTKMRGRLGSLPNTFGGYETEIHIIKKKLQFVNIQITIYQTHKNVYFTCDVGVGICLILNIFLDRRNMLLVSAGLLILFLILMSLIPETPGWYISKGKTAQSRKTLQWLRGKDTDITNELIMIEKLFIESERNVSQSTISKLLKRNNLKPLLVSLGLMWFQQMSGIYVIEFYRRQIFVPNGMNPVIFLYILIPYFMITHLIDKVGRKMLLYTSSVLMALSLFFLGGFFYAKSNDVDETDFNWLPMLNIIVYLSGYVIGFGPIPWLIMGEILPARIRGSAASIVTSFNWMCNFIVAKTFEDVIAVVGKHGIFWLFGVFVVLGFIFVITNVPETSGKSPKEIEESFD